ncbi:MAG: SMC-Scp complex subunit ScpB [Aciduliprofundum sp.]|nr:SMC-Scp complex subunit ScpB [Thermoplasmatales archaeon]PMP73670.1 MAG: SMC-Scp complex subunit ScpB [Aciduliprofundum sp.]
MMEIKQLVEASLFASEEPLKASEIGENLRVDTKTVYKAIKELKREYDERQSAIEIVKIGQRYIMQLREGYREIGNKFAKPELDRDVLKTLAVIAYYQPIKQSKLRELIGEKVYEHVDLLKRKRLVTTRSYGKTELISVTKNFSSYFGIDAKDPQSIKRYLAEKLNLKLEG